MTIDDLKSQLRAAGANPDALRKWAEALKSGQYQQAPQRLRTSAGFCCLGVMCDVAGVGWKEGEPDFFYTDQGNTAYPTPGQYREFLGTDVGRPFDSLSRLNDEEGWTFEQIADLLLEVAQ